MGLKMMEKGEKIMKMRKKKLLPELMSIERNFLDLFLQISMKKINPPSETKYSITLKQSPLGIPLKLFLL